jgi:ABC-type transport system substrate-binding protein
MFAVLLLPVAPVTAWSYNDGTPDDQLFESFGPRADKLLIKLYSSEVPEWEGLAAHEIDITDWPLDAEYYNLFQSDEINPATGLPYNETINVLSYGAEFGLFILDINNNPNEYLGNPPDPAYLNPVYPNPTSVKEMRQAIAHLVDRTWLETIIGPGFYFPVYTPVPPCYGGFAHPEIVPGGALDALTYPYSRAAAEALLDAAGFKMNPTTGWRYWDRDGDDVEDPDEYLELKFFIRQEHDHRREFGTNLVGELEAVGVRVNAVYGTISAAWYQVFQDKDFNLYTGGWSLGADPDHLILWNWDFYWHPGFCYNYGGANNATFNDASYGVMYANTVDEARTWAWLAQEAFAGDALSVPLWSYSAAKAVSRYYTGDNAMTPIGDGEDKYRGQYWEGMVNVPGYGVDSGSTFLNMHPQGYERGDGENMTIRWAFKTTDIRMFNPVYAEWLWDWNVLGLVYFDSLLSRNPYDLSQFTPWLASSFEVGTYEHPIYGTCTKAVFTLRPDATWMDGTPITIADIEYTFVQMKYDLEARGLPPPWWIGNVENIISFSILDPYNFEVLLDVKSVWAIGWIGGNIILPKHVWKPLICGPDDIPGTPDDPSDDIVHGSIPEPNMIGSGPWRFEEYVEFSHIRFTANTAGSTVTTSHPGSTPITSPYGWWRFYPVDSIVYVNEFPYCAKIPYDSSCTLNSTDLLLWFDSNVALNKSVDLKPGPNAIMEFRAGRSITILEDSTFNFLETAKIELNGIQLDPISGQYEFAQGDHIHFITSAKVEFQSGANIRIFEVEKNLQPQVPNSDLIDTILKVVEGIIEIKVTIKLLGLIKDPGTILWFTIREDIIGSIYYDPDLPAPDFKVNLLDVAYAAAAFGAYPGHERWNPVCDISGDYKIDIVDVANIAAKFGWEG